MHTLKQDVSYFPVWTVINDNYRFCKQSSQTDIPVPSAFILTYKLNVLDEKNLFDLDI